MIQPNRLRHRRRIELEDKAKVDASDWGTESLLSQLFCPVFLKQMVEFSRPPCYTQPIVSKRPRQNSQRGNDSVSQSDATTFALCSNSILLLWLKDNAIYIGRCLFNKTKYYDVCHLMTFVAYDVCCIMTFLVMMFVALWRLPLMAFAGYDV